MSLDSTIETVWNAHHAGDHFPQAQRGQLDRDQGYRVQQGLLQKYLAQGAAQAGWKIGVTSDAVRALFSLDAPVFGYLLESTGHPTGQAFRQADFSKPALESEVMLVLGQDLAGPGVTAEQARAAVKEIVPAFEIIANRGGDVGTDLALALADNVMHAAYVMGEAIPLPADLDFASITAEIMVNGEVTMTARCGDVMDQPLDSLAWLANTLSGFGLSLSAGQRILTGSFNKPFAINPGDRLETRFSGLGSVSASFS